jgi:putative ABC transport system permease protein
MREIFVRHWFERPGRFFLIVLGLVTATTAIVAVVCASFNARESYSRLNRLASGIPAIDVSHFRGQRFDPMVISELRLPFISTAAAPMLFRGTIARHRAARLRCILLGVPLGASEGKDQESSSHFFDNPVNRLQLASYLGVSTPGPLGRTECLISVNTSTSLQVQAGDEVQLLFRRSIQKLVVREIIPDDVWQAFALEPSIIVDLASLQNWANLPDQVDRVRYFVEDDDEETREGQLIELNRTLSDPLVATVRTSAFGSAASVFRSAELGLGFATALAGAMSLYILLNTIRMSLLERRRHFAILRCIGATPLQIFRALISETVVVSVLASLIGLATGIALGRSLHHVLLSVTIAKTTDYLVPWSNVLALTAIVPFCALVVTSLAFWEQRHVSPLESFREPPKASKERFPTRWVAIGLGLWTISLLALLAVQSERIPYIWAIPAGLLTLIAYLMFLPLGWVPLLSALSYLNREGRWFSIVLANYQLTRRVERTSLSAGFLVIALCGAIGLGQALMSNVSELRRWYQLAFSGDLFLVSRASQASDADDPIRSALSSFMPDSVQWYESIRFLDVQIDGLSVSNMVREFPEGAPFPGVLKELEPADAFRELREGKLLMNAILAKRLGKRAGDRVLIQYLGQGFEFEIAGTFVDFRNGGMSILMARRTAQTHFVVTGFDLMAIQCSKEEASAVTQSLQALEAANSLQIVSGSDLRASIDSSIASVILGITLVVFTSFAIGGLGIASTMAMNVAEQSKEFSLLRLVGMTRGQVLATVMIQGISLGIIGSVFGWLGGITTAWIIQSCSEAILGYTPRSESSWQLPLLSIAGTMFAVVLASLVPAYHATKVDPKKSLEYEE